MMQETSNTTPSSTNTFFDKTICVWIIGSSCGVKDCVFSQPVANYAHKLLSFIAVKTANSRQQELHVHHRISDRFAAFVRQRFDKTET